MTIKPVAWMRRQNNWVPIMTSLPRVLEIWRDQGCVLEPLYGPEAMAEIERLRHALSQIVDRSHNGELGTAKVIDMRRIAKHGLAGEDSSMTDEHLWHFWNEKARALAAENAALRQQLAEARNKALDEAASSVKAVAHEGRHASMWRNKFEQVAETIRLMKVDEP